MEPIHFTLVAAALISTSSSITPLAVKVPEVSMSVTLAYSEHTKTQTYAGHYYRGDFAAVNHDLILKADRTYTALWRSCCGEYGSAKGIWRVADKQIVLKPSEETGDLKGRFRTLEIHQKENLSLLPAEDRAKKRNGEVWEILYLEKMK